MTRVDHGNSQPSFPTAAAAPILRAENLSFAYGARPVLRDVHLTLAPAQLTVLLGPNGSGKSTLIRSLLGILPARGQIDWFGKPLAKWRRRDLARRVAYLPQSPVVEPDQTVADVLRLGRAPYWGAFGLESARDAQVVGRVAAQLGLSDLLDRPMDSLSGGQAQRVLIGRCVSQEPAVLLLDEPEAHLDLRHGVELCLLLRELAAQQSISILLAVHDLNLAAAFADHVVLLRDGAVAADGNLEVLTPELLSDVYGLPMARLAGANSKPVFVPAAYEVSSPATIR